MQQLQHNPLSTIREQILSKILLVWTTFSLYELDRGLDWFSGLCWIMSNSTSQG